MREYRQNRFRRPPGSIELLLVRHGESEAVRPGETHELWEGRGDPGLAPAGRIQADRVAELLAREDLAAVYVTSLRRTAQTAAPLLARLGLEARVEPGLEEVSLGGWEGGEFRRRVADGDPLVSRMLAEEEWAVIPGAESVATLTGRTVAAVGRIAERHPDRTVAAVVHGGVIGALLAAASRSRPFAFVEADNGSVSRLVVAGDRWTVRAYNDTAHLAGLDSTGAP